MLRDLAFLAQDLAQAGRAGIAALAEEALREEAEHDRRQDLHQLGGLVTTQASGLTQAGFGPGLRATKDMSQDRRAVGLAGRCSTATQYGPQHAAQVQAGVVFLQGAEQSFGTLWLGRILAQCTQQQRQRGADGAGGLHLPGAQLLGNLLQRRALQLLEEFFGEAVGAHGGMSSRT